MGKKHKNRKEYPGKQQNEWENNNIEEPSNEDTSFTAKEVFANSQVDANAEEESDTEAEEEFTETAEEVFANSYVDARAGEESDTEEANNIRGTAYAIRGVAYYQLLRIFCEVPRTGEFDTQLGLPIVTTFDMEEKPLRSTMQATINQIESDLQKAASYHINDNIYRFTEDVIKGYQARM